MINLFEYQNKVRIDEGLAGLERFLDQIWHKREQTSFYAESTDPRIESQRFLQFIHRTGEMRSDKYVGVIHYQGRKINLLPKIFFDPDKDYTTHSEELEKEVGQIQNHILWWLSYCRKIKFPSYQAALGSAKSDFFEVLIYLFSKYTRELLSSAVYQQYEEMNRELPFIKGRLNINAYISENVSRGKWHKLNCTYEAFVTDNAFNRIIKYVAGLLLNATTNHENKKYLREILFMLDEVTDEKATAQQCKKISFGPMFEKFEAVRDYCELFLTNCISFDYKNDLKLFAFLLPMEYVFEDFIFGFIDKELEQVKAKAQRSDTFLDDAKHFSLRPDLWLKTPDKSVIADTKYKIVYSDENDPKKGISQADLYQMVAYAVRFGVDEVMLFYPNTVNNYQQVVAKLVIKDTLAEGREIQINAFQLPVLNKNLLHEAPDLNKSLTELFETTRQELKEKIAQILLQA